MVKISSFALVLAVAVSRPALAQDRPSPRVNIERILGQRFPDARIATPTQSPAMIAQANSYIPPSLLSNLPNCSDRAVIAKHLGNLSGSIREIPYDKGYQILGGIANRGITSIEFFTDSAFWRQGTYYFLSPRTVHALLQKFNVPLLTPISGGNFQFEGLLLGNRHVYVFYDRGSANNRLQLYNPQVGYTFSCTNTVDQFIEGRGSIFFPLLPGGSDSDYGIGVVTGPALIQLKRATIMPQTTEVQVETSMGTWSKTVDPITRR